MHHGRLAVMFMSTHMLRVFNQGWAHSELSWLLSLRWNSPACLCLFQLYSQQEQKILSLETEMEGYKKSIQKEQEQNEKLTLILAKTERDIESVKKQLTQCQARFDALKAEYTIYTRMLHETEQALNRATAVSHWCGVCSVPHIFYIFFLLLLKVSKVSKLGA